MIRGANFGHLATLMRDGAPTSIRYGSISKVTRSSFVQGRAKSKNTKRDPRVGLSVIAMDNPYKEAQFRGRIIEQRPDRDFAVIDRISRKYTGKPFPFREKPAERVVLVIAVERVRYLALPFVHSPTL